MRDFYFHCTQFHFAKPSLNLTPLFQEVKAAPHRSCLLQNHHRQSARCQKNPKDWFFPFHHCMKQEWPPPCNFCQTSRFFLKALRQPALNCPDQALMQPRLKAGPYFLLMSQARQDLKLRPSVRSENLSLKLCRPVDSPSPWQTNLSAAAQIPQRT